MLPFEEDFLRHAWQAAVKSGHIYPEMAACEAALESGCSSLPSASMNPPWQFTHTFALGNNSPLALSSKSVSIRRMGSGYSAFPHFNPRGCPRSCRVFCDRAGILISMS
jgi:hypothetical protein